MVAKFINGSSFVIKIIEPAAKSIKSVGGKYRKTFLPSTSTWSNKFIFFFTLNGAKQTPNEMNYFAFSENKPQKTMLVLNICKGNKSIK